MSNTKVLFILKRREDYSSELHSDKGLSTGLFNSATFMQNMLSDSGIEAELEVVADNNDIDRQVSLHKPTHVIIEGLWVVPEKFSILSKLHPTVKWIIRVHSELPFLAGEGMAMGWLGDYMSHKNIIIAPNAPRALREIREYLSLMNGLDGPTTNSRVVYLPNFYPQQYKTKPFDKTKSHIDVGCFGAVRPLKNHLVQALAAIKFGEMQNKPVRFHINAGRIEMNGQPALHNLMGLFENLHQTGHELVSHNWTPRDNFLQVCTSMDLGMQVSFSETFNIVGADLISQGVPLVASSEIPWSSSMFDANPTESLDIANKLAVSYAFPQINVWLHQRKLTKYTSNSKRIWVSYFS